MTTLAPVISLFKEQLENEAKKLAEQHGLKKRGDHLIWWYFLHLVGLPIAEVNEAVCDDGNDLGIDSLRIDENDFVHFYQFKNPEDANNAFPEGDVDRTLGGLRLILSKQHEKIANDDLKARIEEVYQILPQGYRLHLVTSGSGISKEARLKLDNFVAELKGPSDSFFTWQLEDIGSLQDTFYRKNLPTVTQPVTFSPRQNPYQVRSANHDCYLFHLTGKELANLYQSHGEQLLQQNIRVFQGDHTTNASIHETSTGNESANFFHFNNGITFLVENATWDAFVQRLTINKIQVVNGGQTTRVLARSLQEGKLRDDVVVPVRVITSQGDKDFGNNVAVNLNNQNKVESSFLRSNNPRVIQLE